MKISKILGKWFMAKSIVCMAVLTIMLYATPVHAVPILNFSTGDDGVGGTITPGMTTTGTDILIGSLTVVGTAMDGVYDVSGAGVGYLDSTTALLSFAYDGEGINWLTIVGGIPSLFIADGTTLLSGLFTSFSFIPSVGIYGSGVDTKDSDLLTALGIDPDTSFELFGISIGFDPLPLGGPITVSSTNIKNTAVPEPSTLLLLGFGLTALGLIRRKVRKG